MDQMKKYTTNKIVLFCFFTILSANFIQIGSLVTEIQNFGNDVRLILYQFIAKGLFFDFIFEYQILLEFTG